MATGNADIETAAVVRRFVEELMVEHWSVVDALALTTQVGAVPAAS